MVDYDSDEDEDEDEDEDDEEDVGEDEDAVEDEEEDGEEALEDGVLSQPATVSSIVDVTKPISKEETKLVDSTNGESVKKQTKPVLNIPVESSSSPSAIIASNKPLNNSDGMEGSNTAESEQMLDSTNETSDSSATPSSTHDEEQSSTEDSDNSIVQNKTDSHNETAKEEVHSLEKESEHEHRDISSAESKATVGDIPQNLTRVTGSGDGEKLGTVKSLARSNKELDDDDAGDQPVAKRQKLCSAEKECAAGDTKAEQELPDTS